MNKILIAIVILNITVLYQFAVWFENAIKNVGWFDGLTIPIVSVGALFFIVANMLVLFEALENVELRREEQK